MDQTNPEPGSAPSTSSQDVPHLIVEHIFDRATAIAPGVTLHTRDGSAIGNAIVLREVKPETPTLVTYLENTNQKMWSIETDFGNKCRLCDREIEELFTLGFTMNYEAWWDQRMDAIKVSVENFR